jgi:hypothetical protein
LIKLTGKETSVAQGKDGGIKRVVDPKLNGKKKILRSDTD